MSNELDDLLGEIPITPRKEESIDDLLGEVPLHVPKGKAMQLPVVTGPLIAFTTRLKGELIIAPGTKYYVVRDEAKRLHYKEASACKILPDNWKEGDPIPPLD